EARRGRRRRRGPPSPSCGMRRQRTKPRLQRHVPVPLVALELERRVDQAVVEPWHPVGPLESDDRDPGGAVIEGAPEVPVSYPRAAREPYATHAKDWARVARAARLEISAQSLQLMRRFGETDFQIYPLLGAEIVGPEELASDR